MPALAVEFESLSGSQTKDRSSDLTGEASQPSPHHLGAADRVAVVRTSRIGGVRLVIVLAVIALCRR
jgi:hypothetical protein